jgi:hypothetical protein
MTTIAGNGQKGYAGDGGPALSASFTAPHEIRFDRNGHLFVVERDAHVVRRIDAKTRVVSTVAGTGVAGFSGDEGPAAKAALRQPHSIAFERVHWRSARERQAALTKRRSTARRSKVRVRSTRTAAAMPRAARRQRRARHRHEESPAQRIAGTSQTGSQATPRGHRRHPQRSGHRCAPTAASRRRHRNHAVRQVDLAAGVITTLVGGRRGDGGRRPAGVRHGRPRRLLPGGRIA